MAHYTCVCTWQSKSSAPEIGDEVRPFIGAFTESGDPMHVVRFQHSGDLLPGYHIPTSMQARSSYGGSACESESYEVLLESHDSEFTWVPESYGRIVHGAVQGGTTSGGEKLFIGRAKEDGSWKLGKIHRSHGCCYFCLDGEEHKKSFYEVLACNLIKHYQSRNDAIVRPYDDHEDYDGEESYEDPYGSGYSDDEVW